ncbi:MAG TPA: periplasmic heavy metal sensor [Thermoanaerobaculia bacterium]|nr:periplasmic heavy metal sensor [Thermoanaerobaculia bacterium]
MKSVLVKSVLALGLAALAAVPAARALVPGAPAADDPFAAYLYPPDQVMGHSLELGLDDSQKKAIKDEVQKVQGKFVDLQFEMQAESEKMIRLLQEKPADETKVLAEVDRILALEKEIKKMQVSLLVRIKNLLTPAQQAKMSEIRKTAGQ